ncbi:MAG TPA: phosphoglucosamine mutase [Clostridia bacterium]
MGKYFGTDGIRGIPNKDLTLELAVKTGNALTSLKKNPLVVIGTDTRESKDMLKTAVTAGILAGGGNVIDLGILTTPGVSYITTLYNADFGVVISASHNPAEYNGIKVFDNTGAKLGETEIEFIEKCIDENIYNYSQTFGTLKQDLQSHEKYIDFLAGSIEGDLKGLKVVLDCSNGASYEIAPKVFEKLGAEVYAYNLNNTGSDINVNCGALHEQFIIQKTKEHQADIGFAFDGDADRVIGSSKDGKLIDGDLTIYILAKYLKQRGQLPGDAVVGTHHTNMGMELALQKLGVKLIRTDIGDHFVASEMQKRGLAVGGEQSGHIILHNFEPTGDGILAALQLVNVLKKTGKSVQELVDYETFPQVNINIKTEYKHEILKDESVQAEIQRIGKELAQKGRLLVRASGTEPKVRIMVECSDKALAEQKAQELEKKIKEAVLKLSK